MGRPIPEVREDMLALANEMEIDGWTDWADRLTALAADTYRNTPNTRAPITSRKLTASMARAIRSYIAQHPRMSQQEVADRFAVNPGRISEAIAYKK